MPTRLTWPFFVVASILGAKSARTALCANAQGPSADDDGGAAGVIGPDVIVGVLSGIQSYGSVDVSGQGNYVSAFAMGTTSCNIGDDSVQWDPLTNQHPVIRSGMYRLKNNRFEQIGISWVKHGFFALNESGGLCGLACQNPGGDGSELRPGCSDPYTAGLNGSRSNLGPASQINAHTGQFPYPPTRPTAQNAINGRLQVHNVDLNPALNAGASYYMDGHYVTPDDAAAGNGNNNVSYRRITITQSTSNPQSYTAAVTDTTQVEQPALRVWHDHDPSVVQTDAQVPGEGLFILAAKVTDLGTGFWRYEYSLYNMNSDRSGRSLTIPVAVGALVQNIGFHDVDYHSGEPWDGTDWASSATTGKIIWNTDDFATNPNANALRWGSLYNFRFDSSAPPGPSTVTLGLFKPSPGFPTDVTIDTVGPGAGFRDCNNNAIADPCDVQCGGPGCPADGCGLSDDCNHNSVPDECEADCNNNGVADSCDLSSGTSEDCNGNTVPDECEPDCNHNGIPVTCETLGDTDGDGIDNCEDECPLTTPPGACVPPAIVGCFFRSGICIQNYPNYSCRSLGGTPLCDADNPGSCGGPPCPETLCHNGCLIGDFDGDADFDLLDSYALLRCFSGEVGSPAFVSPPTNCLLRFDFNNDGAVDLYDFEAFEREFAGPRPTP